MKHQQSIDQGMSWQSIEKIKLNMNSLRIAVAKRCTPHMSKFEWSKFTLENVVFATFATMEQHGNQKTAPIFWFSYPKDGQASTVRSWNWMIGLALVASLVPLESWWSVLYLNLIARIGKAQDLGRFGCISVYYVGLQFPITIFSIE